MNACKLRPCCKICHTQCDVPRRDRPNRRPGEYAEAAFGRWPSAAAGATHLVNQTHTASAFGRRHLPAHPPAALPARPFQSCAPHRRSLRPSAAYGRASRKRASTHGIVYAAFGRGGFLARAVSAFGRGSATPGRFAGRCFSMRPSAAARSGRRSLRGCVAPAASAPSALPSCRWPSAAGAVRRGLRPLARASYVSLRPSRAHTRVSSCPVFGPGLLRLHTHVATRPGRALPRRVCSVRGRLPPASRVASTPQKSRVRDFCKPLTRPGAVRTHVPWRGNVLPFILRISDERLVVLVQVHCFTKDGRHLASVCILSRAAVSHPRRFLLLQRAMRMHRLAHRYVMEIGNRTVGEWKRFE